MRLGEFLKQEVELVRVSSDKNHFAVAARLSIASLAIEDTGELDWVEGREALAASVTCHCQSRSSVK